MRANSGSYLPEGVEAFKGRLGIGSTVESAIAEISTATLGRAEVGGTASLAAMDHVMRAGLWAASELGEDLDNATRRVVAGVVRGAAAAGVADAEFYAHLAEAALQAAHERNGDLATTTRRLLEGIDDGAQLVGVDVRAAVSAGACGAMEKAARLGLGVSGRRAGEALAQVRTRHTRHIGDWE